MASNASGASGQAAPKFDTKITQSVIDATGPKANPRLAKLMAGLTQHLHDFFIENEVTLDEYYMAIDFINKAGQMSDEVRNEGILLSDVLGMETLCDEITYTLASDRGDEPTSSAILGPFWKKDAPIFQHGESIVHGFPDAMHTLMYGKVVDFITGEPIANAELDVWHAGANGLYDLQDPEQPEINSRGRFYTDDQGYYALRCIRPCKYPVPDDGPAGQLLRMLDRHPYRPAHIHFIVNAKGYKSVVTQLFDGEDEFVDNDVAFAVKDDLIMDFKPRENDPTAQYELEYNFKLASNEDVEKFAHPGAKNVKN